ncbi:MAG: NADH:quinone oxidoreductase subunit RnfC [Desulfovibrionales bacterium]
MKKSHLSLDGRARENVVRCPDPVQVVVPLRGHSTKTVKKKAQVVPGSLIAEHPAKSIGDAHASISGIVTEVSATGIAIQAQEVDAAFEPVPLRDLKSGLKSLGISTGAFPQARTLVVNGLNPEPGTTIAAYLLEHRAPQVAEGLGAVKRLTGATSCTLVSSRKDGFTLEGCTGVRVDGVYPNSIHPLVIKAATGKELPDETLCVDVHTLFQIGWALETGMPVTEVLVGVGDTIVQAKVGQPVMDILQAAGVSVDDGDTVVFGGPMRGQALASPETGLPKDAFALTVVPAGEFARPTTQACLNCGCCVAHCPARIRPNMIGRFTEFQFYDRTREYGIDHCLECGLCTYWCTSRRPVLQYIRMARQELAAREEQVTSCTLNEQE